MIDYIKEFPLPEECLPKLLKDMLSPESIDNPSKKICVTTRFKKDDECLQMLMACVPEDVAFSIKSFRGECYGLSFSSGSDRNFYGNDGGFFDCGRILFNQRPLHDKKGIVKSLSLSISGYDYIVASWRGGPNFSYSLAEKVCLTLGLTPRAIGNSEQKMRYDDLTTPVMDVVEGDLTTGNSGGIQQRVNWFMRNDYLRQYLWFRACYGVRVFYYKAYINDCAAVREVMSSCRQPVTEEKWYKINIEEFTGRLILQVWASVAVVSPELCKKQDIFALGWPTQIIKKERTGDLQHSIFIFLDDKFLEKYEKNSMFDILIQEWEDHFHHTPKYEPAWFFSPCQRCGRNILKISSHEIYMFIPAAEIYHAHKYALDITEADIDTTEEHIVSKTDRLLQQLIDLGENLSSLLESTNGERVPPSEFIEFTREKYDAEAFKFKAFPIMKKMAQVVPLDMYEQDFLARCKTLNEIIVKLKTGFLRKIMYTTGADKNDVKKKESLKLLEGILNIIDCLNDQKENSGMFENSASYIDWQARNDKLAPLFINNDLRKADAHELVGKSLEALERLGFDTASVNEGYGRALDFLLDGVINSLKAINTGITELLKR